MLTEERYSDAVSRLTRCGYEVLPDGQSYIVRCVTDSDDVSQTRNLDELVDLADLMEWAQKRRVAKDGRQVG